MARMMVGPGKAGGYKSAISGFRSNPASRVSKYSLNNKAAGMASSGAYSSNSNKITSTPTTTIKNTSTGTSTNNSNLSNYILKKRSDGTYSKIYTNRPRYTYANGGIIKNAASKAYGGTKNFTGKASSGTKK